MSRKKTQDRAGGSGNAQAPARKATREAPAATAPAPGRKATREAVAVAEGRKPTREAQPLAPPVPARTATREAPAAPPSVVVDPWAEAAAHNPVPDIDAAATTPGTNLAALLAGGDTTPGVKLAGLDSTTPGIEVPTAGLESTSPGAVVPARAGHESTSPATVAPSSLQEETNPRVEASDFDELTNPLGAIPGHRSSEDTSPRAATPQPPLDDTHRLVAGAPGAVESTLRLETGGAPDLGAGETRRLDEATNAGGGRGARPRGDVTATLDLSALTDAAQRAGAFVATALVALAIAVGIWLFGSGHSRPTELELEALYPYGVHGFVSTDGQVAPPAGEVTYSYRGEVSCPGGGDCVSYDFGRPGFSGNMVLRRTSEGWARVAERGPIALRGRDKPHTDWMEPPPER